MKIIIAICTYKRLEGLRKCLDSIRAMHVPSTIMLDVVVIDNAPDEQVMNLCENRQISYISEGRRGLVYARNAILDYVRSQDYDYCGIVDDDETVSESWLVDMLAGFEKTQADAIAGVIDMVLKPDMPAYLKLAYQFKKTTVNIPAKTLPMGNVMLNKRILNSHYIFDSRFNFTGGEDVDFFKRLYSGGFKLYKIAGAQVTEYLTPEKASLKAYFNRQMRVAKLHYQEKYPELSIGYLCECVISMFEIMLVMILLPLTLFSDSIKVKITKILAKAIGRFLSRKSSDINAYGTP